MKKLFVVLLTSLFSLPFFAQQTYPVYTVATVTTNDVDGVADSLDVLCQLQGIVYGINIRGAGNGLQFTIIDGENNGIGVFSSTRDFGYTVAEGDEVIVQGVIDQFNGLTQIVPDTLWRVSQNNTLVDPTLVTALGESTESQLIQIENVTLVDPSDWTNSGSGFNVDITNGADTFLMRIDADTDIFGMDPPSGIFDITGIGGQFDFGAPLDEGYQILPRYIADIDPYIPAAPDFPAYAIATVTTNDSEGRPDSLGVKCELTGIVHSVNFRPNGLEFALIDNAGDGIIVFNTNNNLGYTVTQGDEIKVQGEIGFFNGLTEHIAGNVEVVSTGNALLTPTEVTALNENTEAQLIKMNNVMLVDPAQWTNSGSGFNAQITDGTNTYTMRIDADVNVFGTAAPTSSFNVTGIGWQFDNSSPYDGGYQIIPRSLEDIEQVSNVLDPSLANGVKIYPNPVAAQLTLESLQGFDRIRITNALGQLVLDQKNIYLKAQFELNNLPSGIYHLTLIKGNRYWSLDFVKQ